MKNRNLQKFREFHRQIASRDVRETNFKHSGAISTISLRAHPYTSATRTMFFFLLRLFLIVCSNPRTLTSHGLVGCLVGWARPLHKHVQNADARKFC